MAESKRFQRKFRRREERKMFFFEYDSSCFLRRYLEAIIRLYRETHFICFYVFLLQYKYLFFFSPYSSIMNLYGKHITFAFKSTYNKCYKQRYTMIKFFIYHIICSNQFFFFSPIFSFIDICCSLQTFIVYSVLIVTIWIKIRGII